MTDVVNAEPEPELLALRSAPAGRFVYSNHFVPCQLTFDKGMTAMVPFYVKQRLVELTVANLVDSDRLKELVADIGGKDFWDRNELDSAVENYHSSGVVDRSVSARKTRRIAKVTALVPEESAQRASVLGPQDAALVGGMLKPDIGYVFLDRTRVTPAGLALGENVYTLSLAPGEEVTLEQRNFSKRETSFEDQSEQERQFDTELDSSYSTEIEQGLDQQQSRSSTWGLNVNVNASYTSPQTPWGTITASTAVGTSTSATEASQESSRRSVKDSQQASSKVAARYRTVHKTTFKVSTEQSFETTSKRTIRNPNAATSLTLLYFKVMQRLKLAQERYGVRLCWAISVKDPASVFAGKLQAAREAAVAEALSMLSPEPQPPMAPPASGQTTPTPQREYGVAASEVRAADKWGFSGDMSADYPVDINIPEGFRWDGDMTKVHVTLYSKRPAHTIGGSIKGLPIMVNGSTLRVTVHIGAGVWFGGPGIDYQVQVGTVKETPLPERASQDEAYNNAVLSYQTAHRDWEDKREAALAAGRAEGERRVQEMRAQLSPVNEMIGQLIEREFPPSHRDEVWEIDQWQRMFEWQRATYITYPSWWAGGTTRDPLADPDDFVNASWVKLYLPVRLGHERPALRWIFGKKTDGPLDAQAEAQFDAVIEDLEQYRESTFGSSDEHQPLLQDCQEVEDAFACLAQWEEYLPTDGTHLEVVQGSTSAAAEHLAQELADAQSLRAGILAREHAETEITEKAATLMKGNATVSIQIGPGGSDATTS
jgi:hypothetical protein